MERLPNDRSNINNSSELHTPFEQLINDIEHPKDVANKFYLESTSSNDKNLFSNYIQINNTEVCCLIKGLSCNLVSDTIRTVNNGKVGITSVITLKNDNKVVIKIIPIDPFASFNIQSQTSNNDTSCLGHSNRLGFFGTDIFTNEYILANILNYIFKSSNLPSLSVNHIISSICLDDNAGSQGVSVMEYAKFGSILSLPETMAFEQYFENMMFSNSNSPSPTRVFTKETILNIVKQIIISYDYLNNFDFNHSDAKVANALVFDQPISFQYKGLNVDSPFTVKLADFDKAAITLNLPITQNNNLHPQHAKQNNSDPNTAENKDYDFIRFFNKSKIADAYFKLFPFSPKVGTINGEKFYQTDTKFNYQLFAQSRHTGLPFYRSYDIYTFLISFMMMPEVFFKIFSDAELQMKLWQPLWFPDDSSEMFVKIRDSVDSNVDPSFKNVVSILSKTKLKCNLSSDLIKTLQLPPVLQSINK